MELTDAQGQNGGDEEEEERSGDQAPSRRIPAAEDNEFDQEIYDRGKDCRNTGGYDIQTNEQACCRT